MSVKRKRLKAQEKIKKSFKNRNKTTFGAYKMPADICVRIYGTQGNTKYFLRIFSYTKNTRNLKAKLHILRKKIPKSTW